MYQTPFEIPLLSYTEALSVLHETLKFGISPMLEMVEDMLTELGNPDTCFSALQIAGTNGKTSTARYTAALLAQVCGTQQVGLYTSPELVSYTERMEIAGKPVSEEQFAHGIAAAQAAGARVNARREAAGERPYDITEFDLITVGACVVYAEAGVKHVVLECGMGGRWDATSAVKSIKAVAITGVGLDHTHVLGDTLEAIAHEKAAIIKAGRSCILGVGTALPYSVEDEFLEQAASEGVRPVLLRPELSKDAAGEMGEGIPREHPGLPAASYRITQRPKHLGGALELNVDTALGYYDSLAALKPSYQAANIACALALTEAYLGCALDPELAHQAIYDCPTPGRFQVLREQPLVLIDACHNPQSVETFLSAVRDMEPTPEKRPLLVCAALADKDCQGMVELLAPEFSRVVCTQTSSARALPASQLTELFEAAGNKPQASYPSVEAALSALADTPLVACGSITLAGEVAAHFS